MSIGKRLKESRLKRNLSQNDVANILEVYRTQIGKYENNECSIPSDKLASMIDLYRVDANYILFGINPNSAYNNQYPEILIQQINHLIIEYFKVNNITK